MTRKNPLFWRKCLCIAGLAVTVGCQGVTGLSPEDQALLCLDGGMSAVLANGLSRGLLEVAPVVLPANEDLLGVNDHFGWPVATMSGDVIIVVYYRAPTHWGGRDKPDEFSSPCVMTRSLDGGQTWTAPLSLTTFAKKRTQGCRAGFGNAIGTLADGTVVCVTKWGVFRSRDQGGMWEHLPGAFGEQQLKGPGTNMGPRLVVHPVHGLVAAGHSTRSPRKASPPVFSPEIWLRWSRDAGETWTEAKQDLPESAIPIEPALLMHEGALLVLARSHGREALDSGEQVWHYTQLYSRTGWMPFTSSFCSITASQVGTSPWHGPWSQDTVEISFNPVSKRVEAVATNRNGGGPGREHPTNQQTINLWSITTEELAEGSSEWRFEGTLLRRRGKIGDVDGMHPGGGVIDVKNGVAHTFVYCGFPTGPSGIFRITRTLDTQALSPELQKLPVMKYIPPPPRPDEPPATIKRYGLRLLFIHPATPPGMSREWYEPPPAEGTPDAAANYAPWFARLGLEVRNVHTREQFLAAWSERDAFDLVAIADHAWKRKSWLQQWFADSADELLEFVRAGGALVTEVGRDPQEKPLLDLLSLNSQPLPPFGNEDHVEARIDVAPGTPFSQRLQGAIDTRDSDNTLVLSGYADPLPEWVRVTACTKMGRPVVVAGQLGKGKVVAATAEILNPTNFPTGVAKGRFREEDLLQFWGNVLDWVGKTTE